jgi:hypothetical protein
VLLFRAVPLRNERIQLRYRFATTDVQFESIEFGMALPSYGPSAALPVPAGERDAFQQAARKKSRRLPL